MAGRSPRQLVVVSPRALLARLWTLFDQCTGANEQGLCCYGPRKDQPFPERTQVFPGLSGQKLDTRLMRDSERMPERLSLTCAYRNTQSRSDMLI